jgi:hypothetical protein
MSERRYLADDFAAIRDRMAELAAPPALLAPRELVEHYCRVVPGAVRPGELTVHIDFDAEGFFAACREYSRRLREAAQAQR